MKKRILSIALTLCMLVSIVPQIAIANIGDTAAVTLTDSENAQGNNWSWQADTHTLSLYNADFVADDGDAAAIRYTGSETLIIKQIGYNVIENGFIEAKKIDICGAGVLEFKTRDNLFNAETSVTFSSGYVIADNVNLINLVGTTGATLTVKNSVVKLPKANIAAVSLSMKSGYLNCANLTLSDGSEISGGYVEVNDGFHGTNVVLGSAVLKADNIGLLTLARGNFDGLNGSVIVVKNVVGASGWFASVPVSRYMKTDSAGNTVFAANDSLSATESGGGTFVHADTSHGITNTLVLIPKQMFNAAVYVDCVAMYETASNITATVVGKTAECDGFTIADGATVVTTENCKATNATVSGCMVNLGTATFNNATVADKGKVYSLNTLSLSADSKIAEYGAVTVCAKNRDILNFGNKKFEINGTFCAINQNESWQVLNSDDLNLTIGEKAEIMFFTMPEIIGGGVFMDNNLKSEYEELVNKGLSAGHSVYVFYDRYESFKPYYKGVTGIPLQMYIGNEFSTQFNCFDKDDEIIYTPVSGDSASFGCVSSHKIADLNNVGVSVKKGTKDYGEYFDITKEYGGTKNEVKVIFTLKEGKELNVGDTLNVEIGFGDLSVKENLKAAKLNVTLDFSSENKWNYNGEFKGTNTECAAEDDTWAWYPNYYGEYNTKTLVLNNLNIDTASKNALIVPGGTTVLLKGVNSLSSEYTAIKAKEVVPDASMVKKSGKITIIGIDSTATLNVVSDKTSFPVDSSDKNDFGAIEAGDVTLQNLTVNIEAKKTHDYNEGTSNAESVVCRGISADNIKLYNVKGSIKSGEAKGDFGLTTAVRSTALWAKNELYIGGNCNLTLTSYECAVHADKMISPLEITLGEAYSSDKNTNLSGNVQTTDDGIAADYYVKNETTPTTLGTANELVTVTLNSIYGENVETDTIKVEKYGIFQKTVTKDECYIESVKIGGADKLASLTGKKETDGKTISGILSLTDSRLAEDVTVDVVYKKASCTVLGHGTDEGEFRKDANNHWHICPDCGEKIDVGGHNFTSKSDETQYWDECTDCGYETEKKTFPSVSIDGNDTVREGEVYKFGFNLPENVKTFTVQYTTGETDFDIDASSKNGEYTAKVTYDQYGKDNIDNMFAVKVWGETDDGFTFAAYKSVDIVQSHSGGNADCTHKPICKICGKEYSAALGHDLTHINATDKNIEYWHCERCEKYFADSAATKEIDLADTVIETEPETEPKKEAEKETESDKKSPQTGENTNLRMWFAFLFVSGVVIGTAVFGKKKKRFVK